MDFYVELVPLLGLRFGRLDSSVAVLLFVLLVAFLVTPIQGVLALFLPVAAYLRTFLSMTSTSFS